MKCLRPINDVAFNARLVCEPESELDPASKASGAASSVNGLRWCDAAVMQNSVKSMTTRVQFSRTYLYTHTQKRKRR